MSSSFMLVRADGCMIGCYDGRRCRCDLGTPTPLIEDGIRVFPAQGGGRGMIVVEARNGSNGTNVLPLRDVDDPAVDRPTVQIQSNRDMGYPTAEVCDIGPPPPIGIGGGIPKVDPARYDEEEAITLALNDFFCRFEAPIQASTDACTLNQNGDNRFLGTGTKVQFCDKVSAEAAFPPGDTILTVRVADNKGTPGPTAQIKIRAHTATPGPTDTPTRTPTGTRTPTVTKTPTLTETPVPTETEVESPTPTPTI